jgi:uncharacterized protein YndB with AHSA1/START domain
MSVKRDASGRRSVQVEVEVPGTPEEVWRAIATGPGISCWFVPTEVAEREGGAILFHLGPGMDAAGTVTGWEPAQRFVYEERDWLPGAPPLASEWIVEARGGGVCVVRVVHSLFASSDDWDDQLDSMESGWPGFFRILRLYLAHFRGQRCSSIEVTGSASAPASRAWQALIGPLGLVGARVGQRHSAPSGAPPFAGTVERIAEGKHVHEVLLRLDGPAPGALSLAAFTWNGKTQAAIRFYLYGDQARAAALRAEPAWRAWMNRQFPSVQDAGNVACV